MTTKPSILFSLALVLCVAGQVAWGQYPGGPTGYPPAGYGAYPQHSQLYMQPAMPVNPYHFQPVPMMPGQPPVGIIQPVSSQHVYLPSQPAVDTDDVSYRITVVNDPSDPPEPGALDVPDIDSSVYTDDCCGKGSCGKGGCGGKCGSHCRRCSRIRFFGEFLYLRARDAEVDYAVEINSNVQNPAIQTSRVGVLNHDYSSGFRAGFGVACSPGRELGAEFTLYESRTTDTIATNRPNRVIRSLVMHPSTLATDFDTLEATARQSVDYDLIDLNYRQMFWSDCYTNLQFLIGVQYGKLEQQFASRFSDDLNQQFGEVLIDTDIDFDGAGLRLGLEWERYHECRPLMVYANAYGTLLAGEFDAMYTQTGDQLATLDVSTEWTAGRIVPKFDLEVGAGFRGPKGRLHCRVGYVYSVWTNIVKTDDFINAVQMNNFDNLGDSLTLDGLVGRVEVRF